MAAAPEASIEERVRRDAQPVMSDHALLRVLRERLDEMLGRLVARDTRSEPEMLRLLADFHRAVVAHFDREEQSGLLQQAVDHQPHFAHRVEALLHEHARMRAAIDALCDDAPRPTWSEFEMRFGAFCEMLDAHMQAENEVLLGAYLDDLGGHH